MLTLQRQLSQNFKQLRCFTSSTALSSRKDSDDEKNDNKLDKEEKRSEKKSSKEDLNARLKNLLHMMVQNEEVRPSKEIKIIQAAKPVIEKQIKDKPLGMKLADAAKEVATSLGGDVEKTESELLNILLRKSEPSTDILTDVLKDIKVDRSKEDSESRAQQVQQILENKRESTELFSFTAQIKLEKRKARMKSGVAVDILGAKPSSYFTDLKPQPAPCELRTWQACVQRDLRLASTQPPTNIYEQMIQWTDKGMLWHFPINNEQGLDDEKKVPFEEHIFLETHLEGWCPEKGPVRHFMELVCVGLSKNHWLSVEEKKAHIFWYRDYFIDKRELLNELGAGNIAVQGEEQREITK